jgi:putative acetyltransferase
MSQETPSIELWTPESHEQWQQARDILGEYAQSLGVDLAFQGFDQELADLHQHYRPEGAAFLLAWVDGVVAGCGGLRPLHEADEPNACEMKRLYVRPAFRRFGLGRALAEALMQSALECGYSVMYLDTLSDMAAARELYASLGFDPTPPYYYNPVPGAHYFRADLGAGLSRY